MEIRTGEILFSEAQLGEVREWGQELQSYVKRYRISSQGMDRELARQIATTDSNKVFSLAPDWAYPVGEVNRVGFGLVQGFHEDCEWFFVSELAFELPTETYPYTELGVDCVECEGSKLSAAGDTCGNCEEGDFIFELTWDTDGTVSATIQ